mmetsp:Transcript_100725/g.291167  ORF Transcript_100725/g.291167 Transcript_100725/m.291167 type:complete len:330 (+) Transcript_100725:732-1721(+)
MASFGRRRSPALSRGEEGKSPGLPPRDNVRTPRRWPAPAGACIPSTPSVFMASVDKGDAEAARPPAELPVLGSKPSQASAPGTSRWRLVVWRFLLGRAASAVGAAANTDASCHATGDVATSVQGGHAEAATDALAQSSAAAPPGTAATPWAGGANDQKSAVSGGCPRASAGSWLLRAAWGLSQHELLRLPSERPLRFDAPLWANNCEGSACAGQAAAAGMACPTPPSTASPKAAQARPGESGAAATPETSMCAGAAMLGQTAAAPASASKGCAQTSPKAEVTLVVFSLFDLWCLLSDLRCGTCSSGGNGCGETDPEPLATPDREPRSLL